MSDKKIVDDYYSQINSKNGDDAKDAPKKPIIAAKKKIVVNFIFLFFISFLIL